MIIKNVIVHFSERIIQTAVFDENDKQLSYLQEPNFQTYKEILVLSDSKTIFTLGVWKRYGVRVDKCLYEEIAKAFIALNEGKEIKNYFGQKESFKKFYYGVEENEKEIL